MKKIQFKKEKGEILNQPLFYKQLETLLFTVKNGGYELIIKPFKEKRSVDQNALMWMWFTCLEQETGATKLDFYKHYCEKFIPDHCTYFRDGRFDSGGTSKLKTDVMSVFLKSIQADAASDFGIQLPTKEDLHFEEFLAQYERFTRQ